MKVMIDLCIVPIGVGVSLSTYIAACEKVLTDAGLTIAPPACWPFAVRDDLERERCKLDGGCGHNGLDKTVEAIVRVWAGSNEAGNVSRGIVLVR